MEKPNHRRERVRTRSRTQQVVGVLNVSDPVTQRLINSVFKSSRTVLYGNNLCPQQLHTSHVQSLPLGVLLPHVHNALHAEQGSGSCGSYTVLARTGLSDQTGFAHPLSQ